MKTSKVLVTALVMLSTFSVAAGDAPSIGGEAVINATIGDAGIVNGGGAASAAIVTLKQSIASVLHGSIAGGLKLNVTIGSAGVVNVGAAASEAKVTACQSIGTIGSDC